MNKKTLDEILLKDFCRGMNHWCGNCHKSQPVEYSDVRHNYIYVIYKCMCVKTYEQLEPKKTIK